MVADADTAGMACGSGCIARDDRWRHPHPVLILAHMHAVRKSQPRSRGPLADGANQTSSEGWRAQRTAGARGRLRPHRERPGDRRQLLEAPQQRRQQLAQRDGLDMP